MPRITLAATAVALLAIGGGLAILALPAVSPANPTAPPSIAPSTIPSASPVPSHSAPSEPPEAANGWIAFSVSQTDPTGVDPDLDIWLVALDRQPRRVIGTDADSVDQLCPAFAPDGRSLAYGRVEGDSGRGLAGQQNSALVVADVANDGNVTDRLTLDVGDALPPPCPVWSPDGDQLAFGVPRTSPINPTGSGVGSEVWVVRLADRSVSVVPDLLATDIDWSPDGSLLAIVGGVETASGLGVKDGLQDARIHLYAPSSDAVRTLDETLGAYQLTWSPDGERIAYAGGEGPADDSQPQVLRIIQVQTGLQEVITSGFRAVHGIGPVWSPDGKTIVYQRVMATSSERHEVVLVTPGDGSAPIGLAREVVIRPDDTGLGLFPYRVSWSPDGRYLLYLSWSDRNAGTLERTSFAVVPRDLSAPSVLLADTEGIIAYDGYDDTIFVAIQTWGRQPLN
jgi:Tol biopolymer transport system component